MKKELRFLCSAVVSALLLTSLPVTSHAAGASVTIPSFSVTLNGTKMDNTYSQYPLIVYKDITYFPMTYYDCRFLGLETDWNQAEGLKIVKTGTLWDYTPYTSSSKNGTSYQATVAQGAIFVNGEAIDNSKETYPLLVFRNVTYFPLTWRFAVDSFGWDYSFDNASGLVISAGSSGTAASTGQEVILPIAYDQSEGFGGFVKHGSYYYYQGDKGIIYQAPVSNPSDRKQIYQLAGTNASGAYSMSSMTVQNDKVFLKYHVGANVMGSDRLVELGANGTAKEISLPASYFEFREFSDFTVTAGKSHSFMENLQVKLPGQAEFKPVGDSKLYYSFNEDTGFRQSDYIFTLGFGSGLPTEPDETVHLYKVNYKTGESAKVTESSASLYAMDSSAVYFSGPKYRGLYKVGTFESKAEKLMDDVTVEKMAVLGGSLFYITKYDGLLYRYGSAVSLNPDSIATDITVKDGYAYVRFSSGPYKIMVFDKNGNTVAKTIENTAYIYMDNGKAVFVKTK